MTSLSQLIKDICNSKRYYKKEISRNNELIEYLNKKYPNVSLATQVACEYLDEAPVCVNGTQRYGVGLSLSCTLKGAKCVCTKEKMVKTNLSKYGVEFSQSNEKIKEKRIETNLKKYGHKSPASSEVVKEKYKQTCLERYGVENLFQHESTKQKIQEHYMKQFGVTNNNFVDSINEKRRNTCLKKYNAENPFSSPEIQEKVKNTIKHKYEVDHINQRHIDKETINISKETLEDLNKTFSLLEISEKLNVSYDWIYRKFNEFNLKPIYHKFKNSKIHKETIDIVNNLGLKISVNDRKLIWPNEIDIFIPERNLAVEINGSYWHSELNGKDKNYHLNKTKACAKKNVKLIHIWEHQWIDKNEIIISRLINLLGKSNKIYARKCQIKKLSKNECDWFLNKTHIQGICNASVRIGLFYDDELVSVMTFGKPRYNKKYEWELLRFSSKLNYTVSGGASRLLSYFEKEYNPYSIISYADRLWSNGTLYKNLGFSFVNNTSPSYYYTKNYKKFYNRVEFQKHKLSSHALISNFDRNLTEWENMKANGFDRIWDCGHSVWEKKYDNQAF